MVTIKNSMDEAYRRYMGKRDPRLLAYQSMVSPSVPTTGSTAIPSAKSAAAKQARAAAAGAFTSGIAQVNTAPKNSQTGFETAKTAQPVGNGIEAPTTQRKDVPYDAESGGYGIRQSLKNAGLDESQIGWDGEKVTYGKQSLTPAVNVNGTTYASRGEINDFINRIYAANGDPLVQANEYVNNYGITGALGWNPDTKSVMINGQEIPYAYIDDDGNSFVSAAQLRAAYAKMADEQGIKNPTNTYNDWVDKYGSARERAYNELMGEKFRYDIENDPAYRAYAEMYQREGERAYKNALGQMAARTGGQLSSMAQSAAGQAQNYYMQQLADRIPTLQQQAYERFITDQNRKLNIAARQDNLYEGYYDKELEARQKALDTYNDAEAKAAERWQEPYAKELAETEVEASKLDNESKALENQKSEMSIAITQAQSQGFWTPETAESFGVIMNPDGTYPSPNNAEIQSALELWENVNKNIYDYQTQAELTSSLAQIAATEGVDLRKLAANHGYNMEQALAEHGWTLEEIVAKAEAEAEMYDGMFTNE